MRRKLILGLVLLVLLAAPVSARAQATLALENLTIQLWPDYDQASVLVIYDFSPAAGTVFPAQMTLRLPAEAQLLAVAKQANGGLVNLQYQPPVKQGTDTILELSLADQSVHHIEFYLPYTRQGSTRSFSLAWPGDYAVKTALLRVQQPVEATNLQVEPVLPSLGQQSDGLVYYAKDLGALPAGKASVFKVSYEKTTDSLSVSAQGVQPSQPLDQPVSGQVSVTSLLPWILGGLGLVLIFGGFGWYWVSGRNTRVGPARRRHTARSAVEEGEGTAAYCAQCGKRAQPADRFCRTCGARLKREAE
jgi:hypothetical protein